MRAVDDEGEGDDSRSRADNNGDGDHRGWRRRAECWASEGASRGLVDVAPLGGPIAPRTRSSRLWPLELLELKLPGDVN